MTLLNDREFWIAKQKSNSIQEQETPGLHQESKSDLLTKISDFFLIRWIRKKKNSDSVYADFLRLLWVLADKQMRSYYESMKIGTEAF